MEMARDIGAWGLKGCLIHNPELERWQFTSARSKDTFAAQGLEGEALTVQLHMQPCL
jgi:hypothetical protein